MSILSTLTTLSIGFSIVIAILLLVCYVFFLKSNNKSAGAIISSVCILACLVALQLQHLSFIQDKTDPLNTHYYRVLLFGVPLTFYFFSRFVLFPKYRFQLVSLVHFFPLISVIFVGQAIAVPIAFAIGAAYCFWLSYVIYGLKDYRKRFEIEFFFFIFFSILAVCIFVLGVLASLIDNAYFYHFYANGIAIGFILVTAVLIIYPDLLNELTEAVKIGYTSSTLVNVDVQVLLKKLEELMQTAKIYQNENLNLSMLAEAMSLTSHQMSELINSQYNMSFSKYIRAMRIEEAKVLLLNEPDSSILSISMETGFKSQSNFYAAFKELTGIAPGSYRNTNK